MQIHQSKIKYDRKDLKNLQEEKYKNCKLEFNRLTKEKKNSFRNWTEQIPFNDFKLFFWLSWRQLRRGAARSVAVGHCGISHVAVCGCNSGLAVRYCSGRLAGSFEPSAASQKDLDTQEEPDSADHSGGANGPNPSCSKTRWGTLLSHDEKVNFFW